MKKFAKKPKAPGCRAAASQARAVCSRRAREPRSLYLAPPHQTLTAHPRRGTPPVRMSRGRCRCRGDPGAPSGRHTRQPCLLFFQVVWEPVKLLEAPGNCVSLPRLSTRGWRGRGSWPSPEHPLLSSALFCSQAGVSFWHRTVRAAHETSPPRCLRRGNTQDTARIQA